MLLPGLLMCEDIFCILIDQYSQRMQLPSKPVMRAAASNPFIWAVPLCGMLC